MGGGPWGSCEPPITGTPSANLWGRGEGWGPEDLQGRDLGSVAQVSGQKEGKGVWVDGAVGGNWTSRVQGGGGDKKQFTALCHRG